MHRTSASLPVRPVRALLVGSAVLVSSLFSACSQSDGGDRAAEPAVSTTTTAPASKVAAAVPAGSPTVPELAGSTGAFDDLTVTSCGHEPGEVTAQGTVHNSTDAEADYVLQVRWVARLGNGVLGRDVVVVKDVKADATVEWTADGAVPPGATATCSYSLVRGALES
jgi:hypothetical protein